MCTTKVVNVNNGDKCDVYVGRDTIWNNPEPLRNNSNNERKRVIEIYRLHLWECLVTGKITYQEILELEGKTLGCHCYPKLCHADVIVHAIKWIKEQIDTTQELDAYIQASDIVDIEFNIKYREE